MRAVLNDLTGSFFSSKKGLDRFWRAIFLNRARSDEFLFECLACLSNVFLLKNDAFTNWSRLSEVNDLQDQLRKVLIEDLGSGPAQLAFIRVRLLFILCNSGESAQRQLGDPTSTLLPALVDFSKALNLGAQSEWEYRFVEESCKLLFLLLATLPSGFIHESSELVACLLQCFKLYGKETDSRILAQRLAACLLVLNLEKNSNLFVRDAQELSDKCTRLLEQQLDATDHALVSLNSDTNQSLNDSRTNVITLLHLIQKFCESESCKEAFQPIFAQKFCPTQQIFKKLAQSLMSSSDAYLIKSIGYCLLAVEDGSANALLEKYRFELLVNFFSMADPPLAVDWDRFAERQAEDAALKKSAVDQMSEEEKEREADKLMTLIARLARNNVIKPDVDALLRQIHKGGS